MFSYIFLKKKKKKKKPYWADKNGGLCIWRRRLQVIVLSALCFPTLQRGWRGSLQCLRALPRTSCGPTGVVTARRSRSASLKRKKKKKRTKAALKCVSLCCWTHLAAPVFQLRAYGTGAKPE